MPSLHHLRRMYSLYHLGYQRPYTVDYKERSQKGMQLFAIPKKKKIFPFGFVTSFPYKHMNLRMGFVVTLKITETYGEHPGMIYFR